VFYKSLFVLCTFSFGQYIVCHSSTYGFWQPLWYLQTVLTTKLNVKIPINKQLHIATAVIRKMSTYQRCFNFTHQLFVLSYNILHKVSHSEKICNHQEISVSWV
jgi:hypothetical protein